MKENSDTFAELSPEIMKKRGYMNIQIYGKTKCFKTKSAERFFKERKIKYQSIDILDKGMSLRELESVIAGVGDLSLIIDSKSSVYKSSSYSMLRTMDAKKQCVVDNPKLLLTPIVRECEGKKATVGDGSKTWQEWVLNGSKR